MQLENLKVFSDLVKTQNFSKAAKLNGMTQSAVSQQLKGMEKRFKCNIIDRRDKKFKLTDEGVKIFQFCEVVLAKYETLQTDLNKLQNTASGSLNIAAVYTVGLHELPPYLKRFLKQYPDVNIRVEYRHPRQVYDDLENNQADIGLVAFPKESDKFVNIVFETDTMVAICSPDNPLSKKKTISAQDFQDYPFIGFDPQMGTRRAIDAIFSDMGISVTPITVFDNIELVKRSVEIDSGISIVPQNAIKLEISQHSLVMLEIENVRYERPIAIVHKKDKILSLAIKAFIDLLLS